LTARFSVKNSHIDDDLILVFKNSHKNDTYSQDYYYQTKIGEEHFLVAVVMVVVMVVVVIVVMVVILR
jgi:hypothetical protein